MNYVIGVNFACKNVIAGLCAENGQQIAKTAVTVPLSARTPTTVKENKTEGEVPEEFRQIALNCGVSPEIFKK